MIEAATAQRLLQRLELMELLDAYVAILATTGWRNGRACSSRTACMKSSRRRTRTKGCRPR